MGVIDYSGGYVIHLSSGTAGFVGAAIIGPRLKKDRDSFEPNNILLLLVGAGILWIGWNGFNGGDPYAANAEAGAAVLNTNVCTAMSVLVWTILDYIFFKKPSVIGAVQGMITGLVAITPAAGVVDGWGAIVLGAFSGSIPWFTMNFFPKIIPGFKRIDDTLGVFHTHAVAGFLGGLLTGFFASKNGCIAFACGYIGPNGYPGGAIVGNWYQVALQIYGALFIIALNIVVTAVLLLLIKLVIPLRMSEKQLLIGDDAIHGEEAYAFFGDGQRSLLSTDIEQPAVNGDGESGVPAKELEIGEEAHNE
jgi:Amt family ammonium transporter